MMGRQATGREQLFYTCSMEDHVPEGTVLQFRWTAIDRCCRMARSGDTHFSRCAAVKCAFAQVSDEVFLMAWGIHADEYAWAKGGDFRLYPHRPASSQTAFRAYPDWVRREAALAAVVA